MHYGHVPFHHNLHHTFRVILTECTQTQGLTRSWNHCTDSQCVDEIRPLSVPFLFLTSGKSGSTRSDEIQITQIRRIIASSNSHVLPCLDISHKSNIFKLCYHPIIRSFVATIYIYNLYRLWVWDWKLKCIGRSANLHIWFCNRLNTSDSFQKRNYFSQNV